MSELLTRLRNASDNVDPETADLLREALAELERLARPRRYRSLDEALAAAHRDANPVRRSVPGGKRKNSDEHWYFAATPEVMREARRLLRAHGLLLKFTGQWMTSDGLVRVEYELAYPPTKESQSLCWEAPPETTEAESPTLAVNWTASNAQRCIHLMALGIPVEDDPEAKAQHGAQLGRTTQPRLAPLTTAKSPRVAGAMSAAFTRVPDECRGDSSEGLDHAEQGGFAPAPAIPGDDLDDTVLERLTSQVAASALRWHDHSCQPWAWLFKSSLGLNGVPDFLKERELRELQNFLTARGF